MLHFIIVFRANIEFNHLMFYVTFQFNSKYLKF